MKNTLKPLFAICLLMTTCLSMFSFANSNHQIVEKDNLIVSEGKDLKELNSSSDNNAKNSSWVIAWSSGSAGLIAWDSGDGIAAE